MPFSQIFFNYLPSFVPMLVLPHMKKVTIYTTPTCIYCKMVKDFLQKNNVAWEEHNVAEDMKARQEMVDKSHQLGVPVVDIEGEVFVGFEKEGIAKALGITG